MKKKILFLSLLLIVLVIGFVAWKFFLTPVKAPEKKYFYISTGETLATVRQHLRDSQIVGNLQWFDLAAKAAGLKDVKPGRYKIEKGMNLTELVKLLRSGKQSPVSFVITKIRTRETLAQRVARQFECDSLEFIRFIENADSLRPYGVDSTTVMALAMPYTYEINWTSSPASILQHFHRAYETFWTEERKAKAEAKGLTALEVVTLASIIEEETNAASDKPNIASVYLNRMEKGMPLQADPTLKYAMRNFGLRRLYNSHMKAPSPYNTYLNKGLPPGPICTPGIATIDAVLNAPKTDYYYFVASPAFDGTHVFTSNYSDHMKQARLYHQELNKRKIK